MSAQGRWRCVSVTSERPRSLAHRYRWIPLFTGGKPSTNYNLNAQSSGVYHHFVAQYAFAIPTTRLHNTPEGLRRPHEVQTDCLVGNPPVPADSSAGCRAIKVRCITPEDSEVW